MADSGGVNGVHLVRTDENVAEIDALAELLGGRVPLAGLLGDLDRHAHRTLAPGRAVRSALTWDALDRRDSEWWPQGIAVVEDGRVLVVSWYSTTGLGSRVTFLDLARRRYRHVLLAVPSYAGGRVRLDPLRVHAGGLAAYGRHLHVAATGAGVHVCSLDDLVRVPRVGLVASAGYRWVLPVRFSYRAAGPAFRYSFLATDADSLLAGEYGSPTQSRRLARLAFDPATALLADGVAELVESGVARAQGAVAAEGRWFVTASHGPKRLGSVHVGEPGAMREHRWATPMGPEDIAWWPPTDRLWSVTEHPGRRWVFSMRRSSFD